MPFGTQRRDMCLPAVYGPLTTVDAAYRPDHDQ